jgi:cAMP phosphodiesterase
MRIRVLSSAPGDPGARQYLTTFLINDTVAIDAGCLGLYREPLDQSRVSHVFLTHTHADHVASLPMFLENTDGAGKAHPEVYAHHSVIESLRTDIFNDRLWPSLERLSAGDGPLLDLHTLESESTVSVAGLHVTPVFVNHTVPTYGYMVDDGRAAVVFGSDSGPTERIWEVARARDHLKAVFLESSFPNHMEDEAKRFGHLTPRLLGKEVEKLERNVAVIAIHIKSAHYNHIVDELADLELEQLSIGEGGKEYVF